MEILLIYKLKEEQKGDRVMLEKNSLKKEQIKKNLYFLQNLITTIINSNFLLKHHW